MRSYTDYKGHSVDIPVSPKRIIFSGETFSDLLVLDVQVIGTDMNRMKGAVYEDRIQNVEDIGFPTSFEKVLALNPDLIIVANPDETAYEQLSKIAPTLMFDTFAPLEKRLPELGDILGRKAQAEQWVTDYEAKADAMWQQLQSVGMKPDETASVFTYYPGTGSLSWPARAYLKNSIILTALSPRQIFNSCWMKTVDSRRSRWRTFPSLPETESLS